MSEQQLTFSSKSSCSEFEPNRFAPQKCCACGAHLRDHKESAVQDQKHIVAALQAGSKANPGTLIYKDAKTGGALFQGGFLACTPRFVKKYKIKRVVNTAKGLDTFFVAWKKSLTRVIDSGIPILNLDWIDAEEQKVGIRSDYDQLAEAAEFVHEAIAAGQNALIHCAQGKSRSSTASVAYIMARAGCGAPEALSVVKAKRPMAQPNLGFWKQLQEFEKSEALRALRAKISMPIRISSKTGVGE